MTISGMLEFIQDEWFQVLFIGTPFQVWPDPIQIDPAIARVRESEFTQEVVDEILREYGLIPVYAGTELTPVNDGNIYFLTQNMIDSLPKRKVN